METWYPMCLGRSCSTGSLCCQACPCKALCASLCCSGGYCCTVPPDPSGSPDANKMQMSAREAGAVWEKSITEKALSAFVKEHGMKTVLAALKLSDTATEAEALAALTALQGKVSAEGAEIAALFAIAGKSTMPEAISALQALKAEAGKSTALATELAQLKAAGEEKERNDLLAQATKDGKLPPAEEDPLRVYAKGLPLASLKAFVAAAKPVVTPVGGAKQPGPAGATTQLSADHSAIAKRMGLKPEDAQAVATEAAAATQARAQ